MKHTLMPAAFTAALLPLVYWVTWRVLTGPFSAEVQSMVIGAVVSGTLGSAVGYWLGTSASSARKDEQQRAAAEQPPKEQP